MLKGASPNQPLIIVWQADVVHVSLCASPAEAAWDTHRWLYVSGPSSGAAAQGILNGMLSLYKEKAASEASLLQKEYTHSAARAAVSWQRGHPAGTYSRLTVRRV